VENTIAPALNAEEWTRMEWDDCPEPKLLAPGLSVAVYAGRLDLARHTIFQGELVQDGRVIVTNPIGLAATLALANAALPDDSPYKITRADVGAILYTDPDSDEFGPVMERVAAKLAALLPPEGP
jgi:hypothetical protein